MPRREGKVGIALTLRNPVAKLPLPLSHSQPPVMLTPATLAPSQAEHETNSDKGKD